MSAPSAGYRRLLLWTAVATFALIVVGGVVRVSDSGLGCGPEGSGFHGWPFCNGDVVPGVDLNSIIEYAHRALAGAVSVMLVALAVLAWRRHRSNRPLVRGSLAAVALVVVQGLLGAATVERGLDESLVAAHLGLAMALLALVVYMWRAARPSVLGPPPSAPGAEPREAAGSGLRSLSLLAAGAVFLAIVAGGYMAGTQNYGRPDYRIGDGAHHACGKEFPTCNGDFMPFGQARLVDIHLTHRGFVYLATILILALVVLTLRRRPGTAEMRTAKLAGVLLVVQLIVGALNVWLDEYEALILAHLALGTLLWATVAALAMQLHGVPAPARGPARAPAAEAVTA